MGLMTRLSIFYLAMYDMRTPTGTNIFLAREFRLKYYYRYKNIK